MIWYLMILGQAHFRNYSNWLWTLPRNLAPSFQDKQHRTQTSNRSRSFQCEPRRHYLSRWKWEKDQGFDWWAKGGDTVTPETSGFTVPWKEEAICCPWSETWKTMPTWGTCKMGSGNFRWCQATHLSIHVQQNHFRDMFPVKLICFFLYVQPNHWIELSRV